jgi:anti-sigma regulatory factor (Ser/Thr protein kinase)
MKKRTYSAIILQKIRQRYSDKRLKKVKARKRHKKIKRGNIKKRSPVYLPIEISLSKYEELMQAIQSIREILLTGAPFLIDFRPVRKIDPGGALILAAELDRYRKKRHVSLNVWNYNKWSKTMKYFASDIGLWEALDMRLRPRSSMSTFKFVRLYHDIGAVGLLAKTLEEDLRKAKIDFSIDGEWYVALTEAMTNAIQHAYPKEYLRPEMICGGWWMCGAFNEETKELTIMFYDQGVGIPMTLDKSDLWKVIRPALEAVLKVPILRYVDSICQGGEHDGLLIKMAFEYKVSQTKQSNRGKGVPQLLKPLQLQGALSNGTLTIYSLRGKYTQEYHSGVLERDEIESMPRSLHGTYIEWKILGGQ